jgi:CRP-like cAMP-binding protein
MPTSDSHQVWRSLPVFRTMSPVALEELTEVLTAVSFADGDEILRQGDDGHEMFLLEQGSVLIHMEQPDEAPFQTVLQAPAIFGEMSLVIQAPRTATVSAQGPVVCMALSQEAFDRVVAQDPAVAAFVTEAVGQRLLEANTIRQVGKYRVTGRLGSGGAATVFEAIQPELGQPVALKMLSHSLALNEGFVERFRAEAKLVAGLRHDHVVQVLDTEQAWGTHFIVMERLTGNLIEDFVADGIRLAWDTVRQILIEVCEALQFAHEKGLLHRDIKPSNVFFNADRRAKILDFGIAVEVGDSSGQRLGTPYYMSPEQILGWELDGRADLYGTGVMAYELITLRLPFYGETVREVLSQHLKTPFPDPRSFRRNMPDDLVMFIAKATAKHPDDRYASCGEAAKALRTAAERPLVEHFELLGLAISYHPSLRERVEAAVTVLEAELNGVTGVKLGRWNVPGTDTPTQD